MFVDKLYLHFPYCRHLCNYCDFYKNVKSENEDYVSYVNYLNNSMNILTPFLDEHSFRINDLKTLYVGGGTPSLWGTEGAEQLHCFLNKYNINLYEDIEFTIEVNPGGWTKEGIQAWRDIGCNRFSIGLQTLNEGAFPYLDRIHTVKDAIETLEFFESLGVNYSVDFMLGLPNSTKEKRNIREELEDVLKFSPSHLSLYILTVGKNYKHFSLLPSDEFIANEFNLVSEVLSKNDFSQYEVSNYAKHGFESKHNFSYWKLNSILALGPSATGFLRTSKDSGIRYKWFPGFEPKFSKEELNQQQIELESLYLGLRTKDGIKISDFFVPNTKEHKDFLGLAESWKNNELCYMEGDHLKLKTRGFLILESLLDQIFTIQATQN